MELGIVFLPFPLCEVDAVHLGFRLSCFTPIVPLILNGGLYRHMSTCVL